MEDLTISRSSWEGSSDVSNGDFDNSNYEDFSGSDFDNNNNNSDFCNYYNYYVDFCGSDCSNSYNNSYSSLNVGQLTTLSLGLLVTLVAMRSVFSLVKKDHGAPVFILNLLISDLVQTSCGITEIVLKYDLMSNHSYHISLSASLGFMVCVSLERYLVIAKPLWYRFRRNIKTYVIICVVVWICAVICGLGLGSYFFISIILPLPFFIFFLFGTIRSLSAAINVPADEKRRIVAILVLVLVIYVLLFLPTFIYFLLSCLKIKVNYPVLHDVFSVFLSISPLADSAMYILMRKSVLDKVFALICCKMSDNQQQINIIDNNRLGVETSSVPSVEMV